MIRIVAELLRVAALTRREPERAELKRIARELTALPRRSRQPASSR